MSNTNNVSPLLVTEVSLTERRFEASTYWYAQARGLHSGPCPAPMSALKRIEAMCRGAEVSATPDGIASRTQMAWVSIGGDDRFRLDPRACAVAIMHAQRALEDGTLYGDAWLRASATIMVLVGRGTIPADQILRAGK